MKKIFIAVMAIAAITFSSCNNGASKSDCCGENDSTCCDSITVEEPGVAEAKEVVQEISAALQSGNAEQTQTAIAKVQEYVKQLIENGDAEKAAQYASQVKAFVEEHQAELKNIAAGNETLGNLINTVVALPTTADAAAQALAGDASALKDAVNAQASDAVEDLKSAAKEKAEEKVQEVKDKAKEKANKAVDDAVNDLKGKLGI